MTPKHWLIFVAVCVLLFGVLQLAYADMPPCSTITPSPAYSSINIRSAPTMGDNVTGRLLRGQVANVSALNDGWYSLAFGGYVSASVVVCAISPTPTRIVTETPQPAPTISPPFIRIWIDIDGSGDYESVFDCKQPCQIMLEQAP